MRNPFAPYVGALALTYLSIASAQAAEAPSQRTFKFTYAATVEAVPQGSGPVDVFIPLAKNDEHQTIVSRKVNASIPGEVSTEPEYHNEFWHGHLDSSDGKPITVNVDYVVTRKTFSQDKLSSAKDATYSEEEKKNLARFLQSDALVPVSGPLIEKIEQDLPKTEPLPALRARTIYDYVVDTMEYKKVGTGWGNGSTEWACSQRYGNCTDFHSLFISLARAEKIPSKFEIGFSIPSDQPSGEIAGYHCWAEFYLPKVGWTPIDASEAKKHPENRELFFGTHPADRLQLSVGRDIKLGSGHQDKPLNYFVFPYVEVGGKKYDSIKRTFSYEDVKAAG
ncbi:MAG: transglutaminase domain-containing protein [Bdellovibrionota bacterium]